MFKNLLPDEHVKSVFDIKIKELHERGVKGIITDLDNTLVAWDSPLATPELKVWFKQLKDEGLKVTVVSNNNERRVREFSDPLDIPFIHTARKPSTRAFQNAANTMGLNNHEVVVIGDQIFTDVFGGNRLGLHTILVVPVSNTDGFVTRFNRKMERYVLNWMRKKGMLKWEE